MKVAHQHDIDLEGACEGTLSCCTCHLVVHPDWYDNLGELELLVCFCLNLTVLIVYFVVLNLCFIDSNKLLYFCRKRAV